MFFLRKKFVKTRRLLEIKFIDTRLQTNSKSCGINALVPKVSQNLLFSCTFPLSQYPKSETPKN